MGRVAGDDVVELVAGTVPGRRALDEHEVLDVGEQCEADLPSPDGVGAAAGLLDDRVGRVDVHVEVVVGAALERVGAEAAVQDVPAVEAGERVVAEAAVRTSWPSRPVSVSLPPPPTSRSFPLVPVTVSLPPVGV